MEYCEIFHNPRQMKIFWTIFCLNSILGAEFSFDTLYQLGLREGENASFQADENPQIEKEVFISTCQMKMKESPLVEPLQLIRLNVSGISIKEKIMNVLDIYLQHFLGDDCWSLFSFEKWINDFGIDISDEFINEIYSAALYKRIDDMWKPFLKFIFINALAPYIEEQKLELVVRSFDEFDHLKSLVLYYKWEDFQEGSHIIHTLQKRCYSNPQFIEDLDSDYLSVDCFTEMVMNQQVNIEMLYGKSSQRIETLIDFLLSEEYCSKKLEQLKNFQIFENKEFISNVVKDFAKKFGVFGKNHLSIDSLLVDVKNSNNYQNFDTMLIFFKDFHDNWCIIENSSQILFPEISSEIILPPKVLIHIFSIFKEDISPLLSVNKLFNIIIQSKSKLTTNQFLTASRIVKFETSLFLRCIPNRTIAKYPILFDGISNLFYEEKISVEEMKGIIDGSFNYDSWDSAKKELEKLLENEVEDIPCYSFDDIERALNQNYFLKILKSFEVLEKMNLDERDIEPIVAALLGTNQFEIAKPFISKIDKQNICLFILSAVYFKNQIATEFFIESFYEIYSQHSILIYLFSSFCGNFHQLQSFFESSNELKLSVDADTINSGALRLAAKKGHLQIVKYLMESEYAIPRCEANAGDSYALGLAAQNGHLEVVQYLMESEFAVPRCQANADNSSALGLAAKNGHLKVVRYLMESKYAVPRCQANADDSYALKWAAQNGHLNVVQYLMESEFAVPRCDFDFILKDESDYPEEIVGYFRDFQSKKRGLDQ